MPGVDVRASPAVGADNLESRGALRSSTLPDCCCSEAEQRIGRTTATLTLSDRLGHLQARLGYRRNKRRADPGLYALGNPGADSPVFASANYEPSFDALRSTLAGLDVYILVLDTKGINVWCAAGEGTFGTDELVRRVEAADLGNVVGHRKLILPQLGAPGVAAHEVKKRTGFLVEYGPVRASDLPRYLESRQATAEMRRVRFKLRDRLAVTPIELVHAILPMLIAAAAAFFVGGPTTAAAVAAAILAGAVLFPALLPWLPTRDFSSRGFVLGWIVTLPFAVAAYLSAATSPVWFRFGWSCVYMLLLPTLTAFIALNFTGSTTFTSKTGVVREIFKYIPIMAASFAAGLILMIVLLIFRLSGGV